MDQFVSIPLRCPVSDVIPTWTACSEYVLAKYPTYHTPAVTEMFREMGELRDKVGKIFQSTVGGSINELVMKDIVIPYCRLIVRAQSHLVLFDGVVAKEKLVFCWGHCCEGPIDASTPCPPESSRNSDIELLSCAFNIAAGCSAAAVNVFRDSDGQSVKTAFLLFQYSAGHFQLLHRIIASTLKETEKLLDFDLDTLDVLKKLSLAQAHHCGYCLTVKKGSSPQRLLSKIAFTAADMYEAVTIKPALCSTDVGSRIQSHVRIGCAVFKALSFYHLAVSSESDGEYGLAVRYFFHASEMLAGQEEEESQWLDEVVQMVEAAKRRSEKGNQTVARMRVPASAPQPTGLPNPLGKCLVLDDSFAEFVVPVDGVGGDPLFGVCSWRCVEEATLWRSAAEERRRHCVQQSNQLVERARIEMSQLGVESCIQVRDEHSFVPEEVESAWRAIWSEDRPSGSPPTTELLGKVVSLQSHGKHVQAVLTEVDTMLSKVVEEDEANARQYGASWRNVCPLVQSSSMYTSVMKLMKDFSNKFQTRFVQPLECIQQRFVQQADDVARLEMSLSELRLYLHHTPNLDITSACDSLAALLAKAEEDMKRYQEDVEAANVAADAPGLHYQLSASTKNRRANVLKLASCVLQSKLRAVAEWDVQWQDIIVKMEEKLTQVAEMVSSDPSMEEHQAKLQSIRKGLATYQDIQGGLEALTAYTTYCLPRLEELKHMTSEVVNGLRSVASRAKTQLQFDQKSSYPFNASQEAPSYDYFAD